MAKEQKIPKLPKGLSVRNGSIRISFRLPGERKITKRTVCPYTKANIKYAENKQAAVRFACQQGTFTWEEFFPQSKEATTKSSGKTIGDLLDELYMDKAVLKLGTIRTNTSKANTLKSLVGSLKASDITPLEVKGIRDKIKEGRSTTHANRLLGVLKSVFAKAESLGVIEKDPFRGVETIRKTKDVTSEEADTEALGQLDVYTVEESEKLINACRKPWQANLLRFLFWTGARHGEVTALAWDDVDLEKKTVVIRRTHIGSTGLTNTPKTGVARRIHLTNEAMRALLDQEQYTREHPSGRVFVNAPRRPYKSSVPFLTHVWNGICARAGVRRLRPYTTRHSFASWMLSAGESELKVANHLGHSSIQMVRHVYGHFIPEESSEWALSGPSDSV